MDLALDPASHDLLLTPDGDVRLTQNIPESAAQRLTIRLATFLGEWFLDVTAGIPYFQQIFFDVPDDAVLRTIFRQAVEADPFVIAVPTCTVDIDRALRKLDVRFTAQVLQGDEVTISISSGLVDGQIVINGIGIVVNGIPVVIG